jgi:ABC-type Na+ transport system ATPase subunit NatA
MQEHPGQRQPHVFGGDRGLYLRTSARTNLAYWCALYNVPTEVSGRRISELPVTSISKVGAD